MSSFTTYLVTSKQLESLQLPQEIVHELIKNREIIINAENAVLGRLASVIAKLTKSGFRIHVINVEKAVVTGDKKMVLESYKLLFKVRTHKNPYRHTIHRPRNPVNIFKKTIKNMIPKHNSLKLKSLKKVKAYIGVPQELEIKYAVKILDCDAFYLGRKKIVPIALIAKELGWRGVASP